MKKTSDKQRKAFIRYCFASGQCKSEGKGKKRKIIVSMRSRKDLSPCCGDLSQGEKDAIYSYTGSGYRGVRMLNEGKAIPTEKMKSQAISDNKGLDMLMKREGNYDGPIYRGMKSNKDYPSQSYERLSSMKKGDIFTDETHSSWTKNKTVADDFAGANDGMYNSISMSVQRLKHKKHAIREFADPDLAAEDEVIVKKMTKFKIKSVRRRKGNVHYEMEEL